MHKNNVLVHAGAAVDAASWTRWPRSSRTSTVDYLHVDAATIFLTTDPARFDVIVTDNLFGDILTDLAAAVTGGIGLAASGNINPDGHGAEHVRAGPRVCAGHRRAGQVADPTAAILSHALLLDHLGHTEAAAPDRAGRGRRPDARTPGAVRRTPEVGDSIWLPASLTS